MSILKSLRVGGVAMLLATAALAADGKAPADASTDATAKHSHVRLTKPWNEIKDLTDDEKSKILAIHQKAFDSIKAIEAQEHADCLAVLTDDQRKEVSEIVGRDKTAAKERSAKKSTTRPAGDATPATK